MSRSPGASRGRIARESELRDAARERVARTSLRWVAREIGISPPGLKLFLAGASPRSATLEKIHTWHLTLAQRTGASVETIYLVLDLLLLPLPEDERVSVVREILARLVEAHQQQGTSGPAWLATLCEQYGIGGQARGAKERKHPSAGSKQGPALGC